MAIRYKLGLIVAGLSLIILSMFLFTWYTTSAQKADGLVINLAGRQRMLSQKMSKEIFLCAASADAEQKKKLRSTASNTVKVFDITLSALADSGKAPLSLDLEGDYAAIPKPSEPAYSQLVKVKEIWKDFSLHIKNISSQKGDTAASLSYIKKNNINLLQEMNTAVMMLQKLAEKKVQRLIIFQLLGLVTGIILMVTSIILIAGIIKNLLQSADTAKEMKKGDLTRRFDTADKPENKLDELDFLGYNLNTFAQSLQDSMKKIYKEALNLHNSSNEMRVIAKELSEETDASAEKTKNVANNAEVMSEDMNAVAAAMEELSTNTQLIAESTSQMSDTSKNIAQNADKASHISNKAVERVETASSRVDDLGNAANKIGRVSETITDISEQTNLLALNATIEAARAGEAGKGFAVVAQEVRNLASRSAEAANEIKALVESATTKANEGKKISSDMISGYETLNGHIGETIHIIEDVSSASKEQMLGIEQINDAVTMLDRVTQENASEANNVSNIASEVRSMANELMSDAQSKKF
ncbi:MAG: type IV pili methyl-accepting chemotaxis transducer N-terminal domain-containing protein [Desulfobacteraceae bacterium]|nr:type IV pili methyl-accepting chemotaxis transducer N-terminal domain-containing protein [Desulfobacteraceae bacterium]